MGQLGHVKREIWGNLPFSSSPFAFFVLKFAFAFFVLKFSFSPGDFSLSVYCHLYLWGQSPAEWGEIPFVPPSLLAGPQTSLACPQTPLASLQTHLAGLQTHRWPGAAHFRTNGELRPTQKYPENSLKNRLHQ